MAGVSYVLDDLLARQAMERLAAFARDPQGAYHAIGAHMVFSTQRNIELEQTPDGAKWPRLSPRTANRRLGKGRNAPKRGYDHMLRVSNRLYQSMAYRVSPDGVEWGTNAPYGRLQQEGGWIDMPEREATVTLKSIRTKGKLRSRFVRPGTKGAESRTVRIGAHRVFVPARAYLGLSAADRAEIPLIIGDVIQAELGQ